MRQFLVILALTAVVWLGVSMSEEGTYNMPVRIEMTGYDTTRFAVVRADTSLMLQVRMSGFDAFVHSLRREVPSVQVPVDEERRAVAVGSLTEPLRQCIRGARQVSSWTDSLHITLVERSHRTYTPRLDGVDFTFAEQYGLYGEPSLAPAEVTLYGPQQVLDSIDEVRVAQTTLGNISVSGTYRLALEPVWQRYADVHPTCTEVELYLPVEAYVEKTFMVPIRVEGADSTVSLKLYPDQVAVRAWVAQRDLQRDPEFDAVIDYDEMLAGDGRAEPRLAGFPEYVRPRSVEPQVVQGVVIK